MCQTLRMVVPSGEAEDSSEKRVRACMTVLVCSALAWACCLTCSNDEVLDGSKLTVNFAWNSVECDLQAVGAFV